MKELFISIREKIIEKTKQIKSDKDLVSKIYIISLAAALLVLAVAIRGPEQKGHVVTDESGKATYIERYTLNSGESYDFTVLIGEGAEALSKEVNIAVQAVKKDANTESIVEEPSREAQVDAALDSVVNDIEYSKSKRIQLPESLSDGTKISWMPLIKKDYSLLYLIPAVYIGLIVFVIRSSKETEKSTELACKSSIMRSLPRFCNQLFLMMNAGLILSDAFEKISSSYASRLPEGEEESIDNSKYFEKELAKMHEKDPDHRMSTASMINEFAVKNDIKEMIRIATILTENEKRGSDVIESLSRESRYLWDERKIVARESGKMIDSKMSFPLGILLILLIVITMAPAMLSM